MGASRVLRHGHLPTPREGPDDVHETTPPVQVGVLRDGTGGREGNHLDASRGPVRAGSEDDAAARPPECATAPFRPSRGGQHRPLQPQGSAADGRRSLRVPQRGVGSAGLSHLFRTCRGASPQPGDADRRLHTRRRLT